MTHDPTAGLPPAPPITPTPKNRAGRDLRAAIGVGVTLAAVTIASLAFAKVGFLVLAAIACCIAVHELVVAFGARGIEPPLVPLLGGAVLLPAAAYFAGSEGLLAAFVSVCVVVLVWQSVIADAPAVRNTAAGVFITAYVPLLASFALLMLAEADGVWRIVVFVLVTVSNDIGGYAAGVFFGKHPMAPSVSPKKSWEGFAGSALLAAVVGAASVAGFLHGNLLAGVVLGLVGVVTATVGDLSESLLKRDLGIKDMGTLLPGHGGLMDRLDSLLVTAPVLYLLMALLVPVGG